MVPSTTIPSADSPAPSQPPQQSSPSPAATAAPATVFTPAYVAHLNAQLAHLEPQKIIEWALVSLPGLYQTTAFGLTGLVILDMISKISKDHLRSSTARSGPPTPSSSDGGAATTKTTSHKVPLIFIDTLHHFPETIELAHRAAERYGAPLHIYKPHGCTSSEDFAAKNGARLWETDADIYDYLVKVEPAQRAYSELSVQAYFTGRRRTQKGDRGDIPILQLDNSQSPPMIKVNALAAWDYDTVLAYVQCNDVPYNPLIDKGYKSIGDVHSTQPTAAGEDERDGRWRGQQKSECGLHKDYLKMRSSFLAAKKKKAALAKSGAADLVFLEAELAPSVV
ncbi:phosphoadenylyl-sulfate reductase (thioredoxin) [Powellomyces hirtus]|uniref:Phosphoadenylyl-sulfate reductase (Thioredoxin) n=1 Tax=Powellomyces hirtus TaxID=109895 RepID=A0A507E575_9FUNG|nr:phosphoadenylyl-sulfate reductase (thioredoxin) [Powellomyces hirtus]